MWLTIVEMAIVESRRAAVMLMEWIDLEAAKLVCGVLMLVLAASRTVAVARATAAERALEDSLGRGTRP